MTIHSRLAAAVAVPCLAISISGCATPSGPSAPPPGETRTLSGVISEVTPAGRLPVEGVQVTLAQGTAGQTLSVTTDASGAYSFAGISLASTLPVLRVERFGFAPRLEAVRIDGDTRLDIELVRLAMYTLSGMVFELTTEGQLPLAGVEVWEPYHDFVRTDEDGRYEIKVFGGVNAMFLHKEGFRDLDARATVTSDTRLDFQLVRR